MSDRLGIWMIGALGGIGTTIAVGARAIDRGLVSHAGLATLRPEFESLGLAPVESMVFGGHEVRSSDFWSSAYQVAKLSGSIDLEIIQKLRSELEEMSSRIRPGSAVHCGPAIEGLVDKDHVRAHRGLRQAVDEIRADLAEFRAEADVDRIVVVNLASTEPDVDHAVLPKNAAELEAVLDGDQVERIRPSLLYSYAAFREGCGYINFTPSMAALCPAVQEVAKEAGLPFMGDDGKTGETLVKSALAPMFKYRNLKVLSWQGYNILGDRDGQILAHKDNLASKVRSKDAVLQGILGYPLHTHVGIDYVESLDDRKTAWDFIHFEGFLDHRMSMQFVWQGCDAILAAPLVLDMVRLTDLAMRDGEAGALKHLACYFKSPVDVEEHDLHRQFHAMGRYLSKKGVAAPR